jgi:integrase
VGQTRRQSACAVDGIQAPLRHRTQSGKGAMARAPKRREMKTTYTGVQRRGNMFVAYLTHNDGSRERRSCGKVTEKTAILTRNKWALEIAEGKYIKPIPRKSIVTFEAIADKAVEYAKNYQRTWDADCGRAKITKEWWGKLPASEITTEMIDAKLLDCVTNGRLDAATQKRRAWSQTTSNEFRTWVFSAFKLAKIEPNPAEEAYSYPLDNKRKPRPLADAEEILLRAAILKHYPAHIWEFDLLLHTGARCSNWYGISKSRRKPMEPLQWVNEKSEANVDLNWKTVTFPRSKGGPGYTVPLNEIAMNALEQLLKRSPEGKVGPVIRKPSGRELQSCRRWFEKSCEHAGIVGLRVHDLRVTFATRLRRNKVALEDIKELLGHDLRKSKDRVTLGYAEPSMDNLREAVASLVPKPPQTGSSTATLSATPAILEIRHVATA